MADRYAVIGHPVAHSRSPRIHARFAELTGQDIEYGLIDAPPGGFGEAVARFRNEGGKGLNVTLPFKEEAFALCARLSERAREARAVNTMRFDDSYGDNTDGVGLVRDLTLHQEFALEGRSVLIVGAGGAVRGVVGALLAAGVARVVIANRTVAKAHELAVHFRVQACGLDELAGGRHDLVINATSAGLTGKLELPDGLFERSALAYDMVYGRETTFLAAARRAGARASDGLGMLVEQAAESFHVWRGVRPPTRQVLAELRGS